MKNSAYLSFNEIQMCIYIYTHIYIYLHINIRHNQCIGFIEL